MTPRPRITGAGSRRLRVGALLAAVLLVGVAAPATAYWTGSSSGSYGRSIATSLTPPVLSTTGITATSVGLSWTQPFAPTSYTLSQSPGTIAGCSAVPATSATSCTATGLTPNTAYTWTLAAGYFSWTAPATNSATTNKQATTTTLSNLTPASGATGTSFSVTGTVAGASGFGTPAGSAVFTLYTSSTCSGGAAYATSAQTLSGGTATGTLQPAVGTYYWQATYTPTDTFNTASTSACSTAITVTAAGGTLAAVTGPVSVTNSTSNVVVNYPAGTASGDLLVLVINNGASQNSTVGSSGWTQIANPNLGGASMELQAWWHTAGVESSMTLSQFQTNGSGASAWILDYKNVISPAMAGVSSGTSNSALSLTPTNVTTTGANATVISIVGINAAHTLSLTAAQTFTTRSALTVASPSPGKGLGVADAFATSIGTVSSPTWAEATAASQWAYITVAFT